MRGIAYNGRLEALLQARVDEINGRWSSRTIAGVNVAERDSEVITARDHTRQHRNLTLDREVIGIWTETQVESGAERFLASTTQGNFLEIFTDGGVQWHTPGDFIDVVQGDRFAVTDGTSRVGVAVDFVMQVDGSVLVMRGGTMVAVSDSVLSITTDVPINVTTTGAATVTSPDVTVTGGTLTVDGQSNVNPGSGPFCALTNCLFTGAPHRGNIVSGT